jgi:hypothetical protein
MADLASSFELATRDNGEKYFRLREGHPQWMQDVIRAAHGDMMPDDQRYEMIRDIVGCVNERDPSEWEDSDTAHEICDSLVDVYYSGLTAWLASHIDRIGYCDQAAEDMGAVSGDMNQRLMAGQYTEYQEIYYSVVQSVLALAEDADDESGGT